MRETGIVRRIDELGRVVIPKEIRKTQRIRTGDSLETLLTRLQTRLNEWDNPTSELNKLRQQILRACVSAAANPKGIYTLTVQNDQFSRICAASCR